MVRILIALIGMLAVGFTVGVALTANGSWLYRSILCILGSVALAATFVACEAVMSGTTPTTQGSVLALVGICAMALTATAVALLLPARYWQRKNVILAAIGGGAIGVPVAFIAIVTVTCSAWGGCL